MSTVTHILETKQNKAVYTVAPGATVIAAAKLMAEKRVGGLLVMENEKIVGIVTERDFARKMALLGARCGDSLIGEIMSSPVLYVRPNETTEECMALMTQNRLRHLPVMEDGKLIGMISIGDLVKTVIENQKFVIEQLGQYIRGDLN